MASHRIGKRGSRARSPGWNPGPGLSGLSSRSTHPLALALGPGGVVHVCERVPGGRAGRTRLGSPTGKTRFSRRRRRPGGNRLVAPASGRPGPQPPAQPHRSRRNAGRQLGSPGVTHSHARRAPAPQATPGLRLGSRGYDSAELQWGRGDRPRRGRVVQGPRCLETDPALGTGREQPRRSCFFPLPPRPPEQPW